MLRSDPLVQHFCSGLFDVLVQVGILEGSV
jgi:hypothetical protein